MKHTFRIEPVNQTSVPTACQIHRVQMSAYEQEAALLDVVGFAPLSRTIEDVRTADEIFLAAFVGNQLVGAISMRPDPEGMGTNIASLVVDPCFQRQGIAKSLMAQVLKLHGIGTVTVQTAAKNEPAMNLYRRSGFEEICRFSVGQQPLELVKLRRQSVSTQID